MKKILTIFISTSFGLLNAQSGYGDDTPRASKTEVTARSERGLTQPGQPSKIPMPPHQSAHLMKKLSRS